MNASVNKPPELKKKAWGKKQLQAHNFAFGKFGESQAVAYLQNKNYLILETNILFHNKEVDIIAQDKMTNELVFVEVKTRKNNFFGNPSSAVNSKKLKAMKQVARKYLNETKNKLDYRFDIISIASGKIQHYENVTWI